MCVVEFSWLLNPRIILWKSVKPVLTKLSVVLLVPNRRQEKQKMEFFDGEKRTQFRSTVSPFASVRFKCCFRKGRFSCFAIILESSPKFWHCAGPKINPNLNDKFVPLRIRRFCDFVYLSKANIVAII